MKREDVYCFRCGNKLTAKERDNPESTIRVAYSIRGKIIREEHILCSKCLPIVVSKLLNVQNERAYK